MKKTYETPSIEVVKFQYRDQVVAASGDSNCGSKYINDGEYVGGSCQTTPEHVEYMN